MILGIAILFVYCTTPKPIEKEYLVGKKFAKTAFIMGSKTLEFIDDEKVEYTIYDKKPFGYRGKYILENIEAKQYIRIIDIKKFGAFYMLEHISNKEKVFEVKNLTELKEVHSGTTFKLLKNEKEDKRLNTTKLSVKEKEDDYFEKNKNPLIKFSNLFNNELVNLEQQKDGTFKVGFKSSCMCGTPSILLKKDTMYLFNYCRDTLPPKSKEHYYSYNIFKKYTKDNSLVVNLFPDKYKLELIFYKTSNPSVYKLKVFGELPTDYVGVIDENISYWTFDASKFKKEDCGDFDG